MPKYWSNTAQIAIETAFVRETDMIDRFLGTELWVVGRNFNGQLGDNSVVHKSSPVLTTAGGTNWKTINAGGYHMTAIKHDGSLWSWGQNTYGQIGINDRTHRSSAVQTIAGGYTWIQAVAGQAHTIALKSDGTIWSWGLNDVGELGDNTQVHRSSPVQEVLANTLWKQITVGSGHSGAVRTNGTLWMWGWNAAGQLGTNDRTNRLSPSQIGSDTTWSLIAAGYDHSAAIKTDGTLWAWGQNFEGALGFNTGGTGTNKSSPVQEILANTLWKMVACGQYYTAAIRTDGTLWTWGFNGQGQLGINSLVHRSSPVQTIAGGTNWLSVDLQWHTMAIKTDGTLWAWGRNTNGELGFNDRTNRSSPTQVPVPSTSWKAVTAGGPGLVGTDAGTSGALTLIES
jgi:alpha-tubulin suppressor-like RCC1 family protein